MKIHIQIRIFKIIFVPLILVDNSDDNPVFEKSIQNNLTFVNKLNRMPKRETKKCLKKINELIKYITVNLYETQIEQVPLNKINKSPQYNNQNESINNSIKPKENKLQPLVNYRCNHRFHQTLQKQGKYKYNIANKKPYSHINALLKHPQYTNPKIIYEPQVELRNPQNMKNFNYLQKEAKEDFQIHNKFNQTNEMWNN